MSQRYTMTGHPSRRDFLATSAKVGAGLALPARAWSCACAKPTRRRRHPHLHGPEQSSALPHGQEDVHRAVHEAAPWRHCQVRPVPVTSAANAYHDKLVTMLSAHDGSIDVFDSDVIWQAQWAPAGWAAPLDKVFPPRRRRTTPLA